MSEEEFPKGDREAHADLVRGMVQRIGVRLGEGAVDDRAAAEEFGSIVDRCCKCSSPGACASWQDDHVDGADEAPGYCVNRDLFAGMSRTD